MLASFHINYNFPGPVVIQKIFKEISYIKINKKQFPLLWPHLTLKDHDFFKLDFVLIVKKLSCKFQLFWASNS